MLSRKQRFRLHEHINDDGVLTVLGHHTSPPNSDGVVTAVPNADQFDMPAEACLARGRAIASGPGVSDLRVHRPASDPVERTTAR